METIDLLGFLENVRCFKERELKWQRTVTVFVISKREVRRVASKDNSQKAPLLTFLRHAMQRSAWLYQ